ncbi:MAG: DegT/DnrJ/EryC1/StrS family aminotransferase [Gemmatimonadetes bacterium]|nr:DegT/DnrJ/EryC1/StrS family aminotransferase [Gemmatimonadota bacterium]
MSGREAALVSEAFASNWIAPLGPFVSRFERDFAEKVGAKHALALSSGTAALHLALIEAGVRQGDEVLVSTFTFAATVNPIVYLGARPVFIDSEPVSWNMDPDLLAEALEQRARAGRLPRAVVVVHLYGQSADMDAIIRVCDAHGVPVIEDAAEALGATFRGRAPGTFGASGVYSFNGNKIITTSGGGMLVSDNGDLIHHARKIATQARDAGPHYQHSEIGYNYRLSNLLAAAGVAQLEVLNERVGMRRRNFAYYENALGALPGLSFMPEAPWGLHTRWLTCITLDPAEFGVDREGLRLELEASGIEARPLWKPMHLQPVFAEYESVGGDFAAGLFERGLCLPSGSSLSEGDLDEVASCIRAVFRRAARRRTFALPRTAADLTHRPA